MAFSFPASPAVNDTYTVNNRTYTWTGSVWEMTGGKIVTAQIQDLGVTTAKIAADAVTEAKIGAGAAVANIGYTPANVASPTFTGTVVLPSTTSIGTVTSTEIGYVDGVTSAIQTQLDSKLTATTAVTSNRNAIINGGMDIYQRGSISAAGYALDRWYFSTYGTSWNSLSVTQQTSGAPTNFRYYMRVAAGSATSTNISFGQSLETHNVIKLAGKVVNLSFYYRVNTNFSTAFTVTPVFTTGTDANISTVPSGTAIGSAQTVTNTTAWTRFSYSFTVPSNATSFAIQFWNNNNTVSTASLDITGVQLEAGAVATPFEFEDYGVTLAKCQRYFQSYPSSRYDLYSQRSGDEVKSATLQFITTLRTTPTVTLVNTSTDGGPAFSVQAYPHCSRVSVTSTAGNQAPYIESWTASAEL